MQAGHLNPDWGMDLWYKKEEEKIQQNADESRIISTYLNDCRHIAEDLANEFRFANPNETDEEFLTSTTNECWHDWLIFEAASKGKGARSENELYAAMQLICQQNVESFTYYEWVLTQVKNKAV